MNKALYFFVTLSLFVSFAFAHGTETREPKSYLPVNPFELAVYAFALVFAIIIFAALFPKLLSKGLKKTLFIFIAVPVVLITLYVGASTVYLNVISESGGPVHWHADFEIWACGEKLTLPTARFPSNYVGTAVLHHHDDNRIHVEGLVIEKHDVSLGSFFNVIGGELSDDSITVPQDGNAVSYKNGDVCPNGSPGELKLFVMNHETGEFVESKEISDYVIAPEFNIPPGDYLKIVFGEQ